MHLPEKSLTWGAIAAAALALGLPPANGVGAPADEHETPLFVRAAKVIVRPGEVLENGRVLVEHGRIVAVGADLEPPEGARVIEGAVVCAGFLDPWTTVGLTPAAAADRDTEPATRSLDGFDRFGADHALGESTRAGVTSVRIQAGDDNDIGGVGAVVRTAPELSAEEAVVLADSNVGAALGVSSRGRKTDVFDRIGQVDKLASALESGRDYAMDLVEYRHDLEAWEKEIAEKEVELDKGFKKAKKDREKDQKDAEEKDKEFKEKRYKESKKPRKPRYDADKAAMARVADGELPLVVQVHRAAELRELLRVTEPFGRLRLVVSGGTEALAVADELVERRIPVIVWPAPLGTSRLDELARHDLSLAGRLAEKGVKVLLGSGGGTGTRDLPLLAGLAIGHGFDREAAFAALTLEAARTLDVADRLGSVRRGRDADLLVLDGEPLLATTSIQYVISAGRVVVSPAP